MNPLVRKLMTRQAARLAGLGGLNRMLFGWGAPKPLQVGGKAVGKVRMIGDAGNPFVEQMKSLIPGLRDQWLSSDVSLGQASRLASQMGKRDVVFGPSVAFSPSELPVLRVLKDKMVIPRSSVEVNKLQEARRYPGFLPDTSVLRNFKDLPKEDVVYKRILGENSLSTRGSARPTIILDGDTSKLWGRPKDWIMQPKLNMRKPLSNALGEIYGAWDLPGASFINKQLKALPPNVEFRVHAYNGQVLPHATVNKSLAGPLGQALIPRRLSGVHGAEKLVQEAMNKSRLSHKQMFNGFDVARLRDGSYKIIETNPSTRGGYSGYSDNSPLTMSAITNALEGKTPWWVRGRRAAITGGVGGAGLHLVTQGQSD